uniref:Helicase ATP-binding domain-containing protein n=1 Tax=Panagrolaimus sp. ES5 TaxID=591445 RepID=A0AC34F4N6_9BILA
MQSRGTISPISKVKLPAKQGIALSKKKKNTPNERRRENKATKNGRENKKSHQQNSAFALPEETLSIDNYYKSCNLTCKNGVYLDPNGDINDFLMGCLIFDDNESVSDDGRAEKVLPKIYENLLNDARANKKILTERLLKRPPYDKEILPKLRKKIVTANDAGKKFEVFNYLQLIDEFLESDEPIAVGATVSMEDAKSLKYRKLMKAKNQSPVKPQSNVKGKKGKNVMVITVPFDKDSYIEEKIRLMCYIYLFNDVDVQNKDSSSYFKVKIAKIIPSEKKGPTTLIAVLEENEMKQLDGIYGLERNTYSIFVTPNVNAANAVMQCIKTITNKSVLAEKIFPPYKMIPKEIENFKKQMLGGLGSLFYNSPKPFNRKQKEAIYAMTRPVNTTFMLFGPPGTGKTYTLVETICQLLIPESRKTSRKTSTDRRILICTPSNMAADAIAEGIVDRKFLDPKEIFRVVSASRDTTKRNMKLDCITQRTTLMDSNMHAICNVFDLPADGLLQEYKIIICTLGSVPRLANHLEPGHFSHIFVDEAAQAPEMDVWLPIGLLATKETRLILAGDPKQLGPVTTNTILSDNDFYGYKKSHLARLVDKKIFRNDPRYLIQLTNNHRSHHGIVNISSELFYENTLIPTKPTGHDSLCSVPFLRQLNFPILFHSVAAGIEETSYETRSKRNLKEVDVIVQYVYKCLKHVNAIDIGVISPYKFQAESIRKRLNNRDITVETVEKYQGSERRVIIISTVRTKSLGFMADDLRTNTALTRAKHLLVVVGNINCLNRSKSWKRFIGYCKENDSLVKDFRNQRESIEKSLAKLRI